MTITICNKNQGGRRNLKELVLRYKKERNLPMLKILNYDSPGQLEADLQRTASDAYLLDMMFPDMSGMELAKKIRMHDSRNPIIFITPTSPKVQGTTGAYATRFFVKQHELYDMLDDALPSRTGKENRLYSLSTVEGRQSIRFGEIMYAERIAQAIVITTADGRAYESVTLRESFTSKVGLLLEDARFAQTHVSYLVNMDAIRTYQKNQVIMRDGRCIPISRKYVPAVRERYDAYCY